MEEDLDARRPTEFLGSFDAWLNERNAEAPVFAEELMQIFFNMMFRLRAQFTYEQLHQLVHMCVTANEESIKAGDYQLSTQDGEAIPFITREERTADPEKGKLIDQMLELLGGATEVPDDITELE